MVHQISVAPLGEGWAVRTDSLENPMIFASGARAEAAARALGERLAKGGSQVEIEITLGDGRLAGRYLCPSTFAGVNGFAHRSA